ncbi:MAG: hypothetical protein WCF08_05640, partial [Anaerolineaceae bacterium]
VGTNIKAARTGGISVGTTMTAAMFVSGGLAGIAGAVEVLGLYHRIMDGTSAGYGFSAMAVAILGALNPLGIAVFAFLFAALRVGADNMQRQLGIPHAIVGLIEGAIIIFLQARYVLPNLYSKLTNRKAKLKNLDNDES